MTAHTIGRPFSKPKKMKNLFLAFTLIFAFSSAQAVSSANKNIPPLYVSKDVTIMVDGNATTLRAGTPILVEAVQTFSSKRLSIGQSVNVRAKFNVVVDRKILVSAGALGTATVTNIRKRRGFGRAGTMELQIQSIQAVDGQQVFLTGIPITFEGDNKKGLAWGIAIGVGLITYGLGLLLGFAFKGKDAEFRAGTSLNASVASDVEVEGR